MVRSPLKNGSRKNPQGDDKIRARGMKTEGREQRITTKGLTTVYSEDCLQEDMSKYDLRKYSQVEKQNQRKINRHLGEFLVYT